MVVNQEIDNKFELKGIKHFNIHGKIFKDKEGMPGFPDTTFQQENGSYDKVIELIDQSYIVLFVGNMGQLILIYF